MSGKRPHAVALATVPTKHDSEKACASAISERAIVAEFGLCFLPFRT